MKVAIFGAGYVGLVTAACLAEVGHDVICVDTDARKVERLEQGIIPIYEPGLDLMITANVAAKRLSFTTHAEVAVRHGNIIFIAVGTPPGEDGSADLTYVLAVADTIGRHLDHDAVIVDKSTVPVGTAARVETQISQALADTGREIAFHVVSNPEFLKEGDAIRDFMRPDRIIVGTADSSAAERMRELYLPFNRNHDRLIVMDVPSAELTKYAANAMLATKISFMNEIANIAERVGADIEQVRKGIGSDSRIGYSFIYPGAGYGGSCFPKDVQALARTSDSVGYQAELLSSVEAVNYRQKQKLSQLISRHYADDVAGRTFALWGLSFKPNTDDMREAPALVLIADLVARGAKIRCYDPQAMTEARHLLSPLGDNVSFASSAEEAITGADALVVVTEWKQFLLSSFESLLQLRDRVVFDGRNMYDPAKIESTGIAYYGIGRGRSVTSDRNGNLK
ncbi:TPA: UDP-glucose/GDP-mannose dehydrogenase family protein [Stenotrophomonas maltophilia]|uniref:UDP-glucose dehydrogenase family protein n=1 Tax=Stenotrophomonas TaxID=40323 RepID=UPI00130F92DA|nr:MULTISPECIES: UDP-glucose/GDP-mannose dehydrogenase family protein [Stenotrophomonas]MBA0420792.1 UDP-glucose/GDP-mannose dehydrogenase family protein [Stenotrophomonas maltophilia]MBD3741256.1 UDP-glucose/GDP-mannose dehydrogenase family protein [Stenotrophomonas sp.]HEL5027063.1 UDP-glucose/GDP-mannose dehydrogenase family protein [Stenotrophomonas maltophilia]